MNNRNILIKKALFEGNISQEKLAEELGVSSQTVNERLNKSSDVDSIRFVIAVCKLTGKRFTDFVPLDVEMLSVVEERAEPYGWKDQVLKGLEMLEEELKKKI